MSEEVILFLSIFGGIIAGALVGALSLIPLKILDNYSKRKSITFDLKTEIKNNLYRIDEIKSVPSQWADSMEKYGSCERIGRGLTRLSNYSYKNYFKDLYLLGDNKIRANLHELYSTEYYFIEVDKRMFEDYPKLFKDWKDIDREMEKLKKWVEEINSKGIVLKEKEFENFHKIEMGLNEYYNELIERNKRRIKESKNVSVFMDKMINHYVSTSKKLIADLDKIYNQNIFIYVKQRIINSLKNKRCENGNY